MVVSEFQAERNITRLTTQKRCPQCRSTELLTDYGAGNVV